MKTQKGFTLVELMIVVVVASILATVGIPAYSDYAKRGKLVEGTSALSDGRVKMEQFFQDNRTYDPAGDHTTCPSTIPAATTNFTYSCSGLSATTYIVAANGTGSLAGFSYSINQANTKSSATPWGNGATCWIMKKGDTC